MTIPVAIAVPIFNARELTIRCLESVLEHAPKLAEIAGSAIPWRLVLVDDASTDDVLRDWLRDLAQRLPGQITLLVNETNLGFTGSANRALREVRGGEDLLLLNSDTEVFAEFLERLQAASSADERIGVLTPFSNNATLCSLPEPFQDNPIPDGYSPASFAKLVAAISLRERPELVTAVGFCMYVKGRALAETGLFNEAVYGRGFGEENDFCEVAKQRGWSVRLCDDLFVWHKGKASFGGEGRQRERDNLALLEARHPGYLRSVQQFALDNPLGEQHARLRFHLPRLGQNRESAMLFLLHASPYQQRPGGTEHHVLDLVNRLALPRAVMVWPERDELVAAEILDGKVASPLRFELPLREKAHQFCLEHGEIARGLKEWLRAFGVRAAHVHHTMRWPAAILRVFVECQVPFIFTAHDFHAACPNWNLFDASRDTVCPCDGSLACAEGCLRAFSQRPDLEPPPGGPPLIAAYREAHRAQTGAGLGRAAAILFPSRSAQLEMSKRISLPIRAEQVLENGYDGAAFRALASTQPSDAGPLRVLILGETGLAAKGAEHYLRVAQALHGSNVELHFIGESPARVLAPELRRRGLQAGCIFHGRIERDELPAALGAIGPHAALLLPVMMETFSYVVSELALAGIPIVANDHGASAERVLAHGFGVVVRDAEAAANQLLAFEADRSLLAPLRARARAFHHLSLNESAAAVRAVYASAGLFDRLQATDLPDGQALEKLRQQRVGKVPDSKSGRPIEPIARAEPPSAAYQSGLAYRAFAKIKGLVPGELRRLGRAVLLRRQYAPSFQLKPGAAELRDLQLLRTRLGESAFKTTGLKPRLLFANVSRFDHRGAGQPALRVLRFRLKHEQEGGARARLWWTHAPGEPLSEEKSLRIGLARLVGEWQDYVVLLDELKLWRESALQGPLQLLAQVGTEPVPN